MKTVLVAALEGVMDSSLSIGLDTLRAAQGLLRNSGKPAQVRIATAGATKSIRTAGGLRLTPDYSFKQIISGEVKPDWLIVPGQGLSSETQIAQRFAKRDIKEILEVLRQLHARRACIGASCSSVFMLAEAGILDGRHVTMTWWLAQAFRARYPQIKLDEARMLVRDGHLLTSGSAYSQLDLALAVVADTMGPEAAHLCSRYLLIDQRPSQARYMIQAHIQHVDPTVIAAERWIDAHLAAPISISELSSDLAVSPKTLARRIEAATGVSPVKFVQRRRLMRAAHLIATTSLSVDAIAAQVGYQDSTALRKLVKREFGTTPAALR